MSDHEVRIGRCAAPSDRPQRPQEVSRSDPPNLALQTYPWVNLCPPGSGAEDIQGPIRSPGQEDEMGRAIVMNTLTHEGVVAGTGPPDVDAQDGFEHGGSGRMATRRCRPRWASGTCSSPKSGRAPAASSRYREEASSTTVHVTQTASGRLSTRATFSEPESRANRIAPPAAPSRRVRGGTQHTRLDAP
jgi:hypothetical protein